MSEQTTGDRYLCGQAHSDVFFVVSWCDVGGSDGRKLYREYVGLTAALIAVQRWLAQGADKRAEIGRVEQ